MRHVLFNLSAFILIAAGLAACATIQPTEPPPPHPVLIGFDVDCENKPDPCWYGIVPGVTPIEEGLERLQKYVYEPGSAAGQSQPKILAECVVTTEPMPDNQVWGTLTLRCSNLKLGNVAGHLGVDVQVLNNLGGYRGVEFGTPTITAWVSKPMWQDECSPIAELVLIAAQYTPSYNPTKPSSSTRSFGWCYE